MIGRNRLVGVAAEEGWAEAHYMIGGSSPVGVAAKEGWGLGTWYDW